MNEGKEYRKAASLGQKRTQYMIIKINSYDRGINRT